ncbi:hypothetical protein E2C01_037893 [Portunus trituberculatus]|uniref:Uncharacterized protein n=1 Tax=Portunus trituberculatus TaxID=210409 RepID=A0A5B7FFC3_PORTR|nr:hypothetical protein [Portunus trituberculatus]
MWATGTAIALALEAAAGRTLPAVYLAAPDKSSIVLIHLAIVSFDTGGHDEFRTLSRNASFSHVFLDTRQAINLMCCMMG